MNASQSQAALCELLLSKARLCNQWAAEYQEKASFEADPDEKLWLKRTAVEFQSQAERIKSQLQAGVSTQTVLQSVVKFGAKLQAARELGYRDAIFWDEDKIAISD